MTFKFAFTSFVSFLIAAVFLSAAPAFAEKKKALTPMELQAIQSREFETSKEIAFGAVMTVIQDLGYTVQSADINSGFITAASPTENKTNFFEALGGAASSGNTVMTVFLLHMPNKMTRIRLNFVNSKNTSTAYGQGSRQDKPILDAAVYNNAWERIDEALFVMGALTEKSDPNAIPNSESDAAEKNSEATNSAPLPPPGSEAPLAKEIPVVPSTLSNLSAPAE